MAFFDELRDKTMDLAQVGMAKSKQLMEIARLNLNNASEEEAVKRAFAEIGKLYYAERGMASEPAYAALCEKITNAKINIEENRNRIAELKTEGNIKDADLGDVNTEVPPEEANITTIRPCDCGCCGGEDSPKE